MDVLVAVGGGGRGGRVGGGVGGGLGGVGFMVEVEF